MFPKEPGKSFSINLLALAIDNEMPYKFAGDCVDIKELGFQCCGLCVRVRTACSKRWMVWQSSEISYWRFIYGKYKNIADKGGWMWGIGVIARG
jgi:hypothetical protein